jgi:glutathione-regulated potassium-efflux system protein KefB
MSFLQQALIFLVATVAAVPLFKRLGLGSVLGYLTAGVVIGPWGVGLLTNSENILHIAEFGVVLLLFVIGLELQPSRLWQLRKAVFGLGAAQVLVSAAAITGVALALGTGLPVALVAGAGLSMSSTAFALQLLAEKNQLARPYGRAAFGILLFQDLAVIPLLAVLPLLSGAPDTAGDPWWLSALKITGVLAGVFVVGRYVLRPVFKQIAQIHSQEVMTAAALLVVVGTALLVSEVGLSMALGSFLAGVMLAESEYKHELEADIEPFKGLLLGLFFIAVGMSVDVGIILDRPGMVAGLVVGLIAVKSVVLFAIGRLALKNTASAMDLAVVISQGGEFAFVLFRVAVGDRIMPRELADLLVVVVSLSMGLTPLLYLIHEKLVRPRFARAAAPDREFDVRPDEDNPVIIAGFGRVGQVVGRILRAKRIGFTALDSNPEHIDFIQRFGNKVFYGDAARLELLRAAGCEKARIFVLAIDSFDASVKIAKEVKTHFPHLTIFARARNRQHAYRLLDIGIDHVIRDTFAASLDLTRDILVALGLPFTQSQATVELFRDHDETLLRNSFQHQHDLPKLTEMAARARTELEQLFEADRRTRGD